MCATVKSRSFNFQPLASPALSTETLIPFLSHRERTARQLLDLLNGLQLRTASNHGVWFSAVNLSRKYDPHIPDRFGCSRTLRSHGLKTEQNFRHCSRPKKFVLFRLLIFLEKPNASGLHQPFCRRIQAYLLPGDTSVLIDHRLSITPSVVMPRRRWGCRRDQSHSGPPSLSHWINAASEQ